MDESEKFVIVNLEGPYITDFDPLKVVICVQSRVLWLGLKQVDLPKKYNDHERACICVVCLCLLIFENENIPF